MSLCGHKGASARSFGESDGYQKSERIQDRFMLAGRAIDVLSKDASPPLIGLDLTSATIAPIVSAACSGVSHQTGISDVPVIASSLASLVRIPMMGHDQTATEAVVRLCFSRRNHFPNPFLKLSLTVPDHTMPALRTVWGVNFFEAIQTARVIHCHSQFSLAARYCCQPIATIRSCGLSDPISISLAFSRSTVPGS
jgi:hypothetical protein